MPENIAIKNVEDTGFTEESAAIELDNYISFLCETLERIEKFAQLRAYYSNAQRIADLEQQDILHKIEFYNENVVNGYKLYKQLQVVRQRRRLAKDNYDIISAQDVFSLTKSIEKTLALITKIQNKEIRKYRPRILTELFE